MKFIISENSDIAALQINRFNWLLFCVITAIAFTTYYLNSVASASGSLLMPVDDAYIHFQYAKQIANGQPYVYNPGLPPTSGATSFLYPYVLALGYSIGFVDLQLGLWAMLIGSIALLLSMQVLYRLGVELGISKAITLLIVLLFLNGYVIWHFMSGMETGLVVLFVLLTLYTFITRKQSLFVFSSILLTLMRPEASIMAVIAMVIYLLRALTESAEVTWTTRIKAVTSKHWMLSFVLLALLVQPLTNYVLTGAASASGGQSKSLFGMVPFYWDEVITRVFDNFIRMIQESLIGLGDNGIWYFPPLLGLIVIGAMFWQALKRNNVMSFVLIFCWIAAVLPAIATLDTAFWHFKRYQLPVLVLMFPAFLLVIQSIQQTAIWRVLMIFSALFSIWINVNFISYYAMNVHSVYQQPYSMAVWLRENTVSDAIVAVHDVGIMRYFGERTTVDMVGLTTDGASDYWRNGPGSTGEFVMAYEPTVDYFAAYTDARGLNYLADTSLYGSLLVGFEAEYDARYNVALGAPFQGIYTNNLQVMDKSRIYNNAIRAQLGDSIRLIDTVDVANIESEQRANYAWENEARYPGFATEFYEFSTVGCSGYCILLDGGRLITGNEHFQFALDEIAVEAHYLLVTRVHGVVAGEIDVYLNDSLIDTQWIPSVPGQWFELYTVLPNTELNSLLDIEIKPRIEGGSYMPYFHALYSWDTDASAKPEQTVAEFQDGEFMLTGFELEQANQQLMLRLDWWSSGKATGDWVSYVHVYDDVNEPPVVQRDSRSFGGGMMPGNWLPGEWSEQVVLDLSSLENGRYLVAVGFYDPVNAIRMPVDKLGEGAPDSVSYDEFNQRLFLREIIVSE